MDGALAEGLEQIPTRSNCGWVAERLKAPVLKTGKPERVSWVRIPPHPPLFQWVNLSLSYQNKRKTSQFCKHLANTTGFDGGLLVASIPHRASERRVDLLGGFLLHPRQHVTVGIQRDPDIGMPYRRGDLFQKRRKLMDGWTEYCGTVPAEVDGEGKVVTIGQPTS